MRAALLVSLASGALAARPFLNEPDTGIEAVLGDTPEGSLPDLDGLVGLPDFEWVARRYLPLVNYTYYQNGAAGEWSARNNLEVFYRYLWRARQMTDITGLPDTFHPDFFEFCTELPSSATTSLPPDFGHVNGELNLVKGAAAGGILYIVSVFTPWPPYSTMVMGIGVIGVL
ncbi:hypothetical protein SODALDRAFT_356816 [Sodiomyces alkalinus F11]|uniref:FMN-dependent dehydrogenase domain-containing protein n=1 Tax=Sodiomyces alkalinus (strain CBS 110278 / VKM F-3762 / F11) TaxID=1314773 RepID=A0A3N2Q213_SODAK|nr:hypothetical protein SODALDRAFT_356816 [Sodiomyces alkalinus F11]ROT40799.1 hypothetical protein SODALDRAFT_356816 [Sodiomyces alkalinus F11]